MTYRRRYVVGALVLLLLLGLLILEGNREPIRLGFVGGLSGRASEIGVSGRNGALLAAETRNRQGGVQGRKVEVLVRDNGRDIDTARRVVGELLAQEVPAIIGHMTSTMSAATLDLINSREVLMMSPTTATDFLSGRDDHFFRVVSSSRRYAARMASYLLQERGIERVALVYDLSNEVYTQSWLSDFRKAFRSMGGEVVYVASFVSGGEVLFSGMIRRALAADPGALLFIANAMDTALLSQQVRKVDQEVPLLASEWAATPELIGYGGKAVEGMVLTHYFDYYSQDPSYQAFRKAYERRFGEPPAYGSVGGFDAVNVVLDAMEAQQSGETLREAILRIREFRGAQGPVAFDRFGDAVRRIFLLTIHQGELRRLE